MSYEALPTRDEVIEALSWYETLDRGRWGSEYAERVIAHLERVATGAAHNHHEGVWALNNGVCECECSRCYREARGEGQCICKDCTEDNQWHDHG